METSGMDLSNLVYTNTFLFVLPFVHVHSQTKTDKHLRTHTANAHTLMHSGINPQTQTKEQRTNQNVFLDR